MNIDLHALCKLVSRVSVIAIRCGGLLAVVVLLRDKHFGLVELVHLVVHDQVLLSSHELFARFGPCHRL